MSLNRSSLALLTSALLLILAPHGGASVEAHGEAERPHIIDERSDAQSWQDLTHALFETIDHPLEGPTLQITLGLVDMPDRDEGLDSLGVPGAPRGTSYTVSFEYGDCGGGRVTYDWRGGGPLTLGLGDTAAVASFWTCDPDATVGRESVYDYADHEVTVTWLEGALQFWVPLSAGQLSVGATLTRTRACTGQTVFGASTALRHRAGIDCSHDTSPIGRDYVVGS